MSNFTAKPLWLLGGGILSILCVFLVLSSPRLTAYQYYHWEVPRMRTAIAELPRVTFRGIYDPQNIGEVDPHVILEVEQHGLLVLYAPDYTSFTGGGAINCCGNR